MPAATASYAAPLEADCSVHTAGPGRRCRLLRRLQEAIAGSYGGSRRPLQPCLRRRSPDARPAGQKISVALSPGFPHAEAKPIPLYVVSSSDVQVRLNRRDTSFRRLRRARGTYQSAGTNGRHAESNGLQMEPHGRFADAHHETRRAREAGPPQDEALYTCQCGLIFQAPVSTSVGCPQCGDSQAW